VDVIGLTVKLDQLAAPVLAPLRNDLAETIEDGLGDALAPVLRHENQVIAKRVNTVELPAKLGSW
jgi:hypothetical protein